MGWEHCSRNMNSGIIRIPERGEAEKIAILQSDNSRGTFEVLLFWMKCERKWAQKNWRYTNVEYIY